MNLKNQREVSAKVLNVGKNRVWFDTNKISEIKEAITKEDIRGLVSRNLIQKRPEVGTSRVRARKRIVQRRKGRQKGKGKHKGKMTARLGRKEAWMMLVRGQRKFIKILKEKELVDSRTYRNLYLKVKGGYFRNKRHIKLYLNEKKLFIRKESK